MIQFSTTRYLQSATIYLLVVGMLLLINCTSETRKFDLLIQNAQIIDGTGKAAFQGDVGVLGDKIVFIGKAKRFEAAKIIDGEGYTLSPGFVDVHTHSLQDLLSEDRNANLNYLHQGVTTVIAGNDGRGPLDPVKVFDTFEAQGIGTNAALLVGHGTIRQEVMGMAKRAPTGEELEKMKELLANAMDGGSIGMSTGLYYTPGNFAETEEVIELSKVLAEKGGVYDSHMRDESSYSIGLLGSVEESIRIAREADVHVNISHIKALGVDVWGESQAVVKAVEAAQAEGLKISADQYPYQASGTSISGALVPRWVYADNFSANINNPKLQEKIRGEMIDNLRRRGGPEAVLFTDATKIDIFGKTLAEIAKEWEINAIDAAMRIVKAGGSRIASFNMNSDDIAYFMQQDWVMSSSDGSTGHPRKYGSYPKKICEYVLEKQVISLNEMIRKSSSFPAETFGIPLRGKIAEGYYADLILFKPEEVKDNATYEKPAELAEGMEVVVVNGKVALENGVFRGVFSGKGISKPSSQAL